MNLLGVAEQGESLGKLLAVRLRDTNRDCQPQPRALWLSG